MTFMISVSVFTIYSMLLTILYRRYIMGLGFGTLIYLYIFFVYAIDYERHNEANLSIQYI